MKKSQEDTPIRSYSKAELAHLYNPDKSYFTALKILRQWILYNQDLHEALKASGYRERCQLFSPYQVALIFHHLGKPG